MAAWVGWVPPLLSALFAAWCGNLLGGVTGAGSATALAALLAWPAAWPGCWRDPLRLGRVGRLAPLALWLIVAASAWGSAVPRAGLEAVVLLPAFLWLPATVARCWEAEAARRVGARAMAAAVALLAAWALAGGALRDAPVAAAPASAALREGAAGLVPLLAPLGHHTLLAVWLATLLPLAALPLREKGAWRWLGAAAVGLGVAAVVAGRSLAGGAALGCEALLAPLWLQSLGPLGLEPAAASGRRRSRRWLSAALLLAGLALLAAQLPRIERIAAGRDPSALARSVYVRAGWQGWRERPWLGWGPGSVPWTAAWFLAPRPGFNPWGEAVGELHSLPVELAYETGALGLLGALGLAGAFLLRRRSERRTARDPAWLAAGWLGLAGAFVAWLGTGAVAVAALPLALAVAAGAALAGGGAPARTAEPRGEGSRKSAAEPRAGGPKGREPGDAEPEDGGLGVGPERAGPAGVHPAGVRPEAFGPESTAAAASEAAAPTAGAHGPDARAPAAAGTGAAPRRRAPGGRRSHGVAIRVYALVAAAALLAPELARWHYDRAVTAAQGGRRQAAATELAAAVRLDPGFPLYRMRLAMLQDGGTAGRSAAAALALRAARDARGVGLLWLVAGVFGRSDGELWAPAALEQGCALDPLAPFPPFYLMASAPEAAPAPRLGARALLAEPRLAAATFWEGRELLFRGALEEVRRWPGVDAGWKLALLRVAPPPESRRGPAVRLGLAIDLAGFTQATSLHLFRRLPWPTLWPLVALREPLLARLGLPPATSLRGAAGGAGASLGRGNCGRAPGGS
jgi:O-Antigen ligase